jgi:hypothetical protein
MPSPFPGMNPYLEQDDTWEDFHTNFITHAQETLSGRVGSNYLVKIEVRQRPAVDVERHASLEIVDRRNRRVVTVIELLSPSNKTPGPDRDDYMAKRRQVLAGTTHLIEIDLRRGGTRPDLPPLPLCDYYMLVSRYAERPRVGFWPVGLRDVLPVLPIPLATPDPDVPLDLRAVLNSAYDAANYGKYIYQEMPEPPHRRTMRPGQNSLFHVVGEAWVAGGNRLFGHIDFPTAEPLCKTVATFFTMVR